MVVQARWVGTGDRFWEIGIVGAVYSARNRQAMVVQERWVDMAMAREPDSGHCYFDNTEWGNEC